MTDEAQWKDLPPKVKWEEPPPKKSGGKRVQHRRHPFYVELEKHPGKWARYPGKPYSGYPSAAEQNKRLKRWDLPGKFEYTVRQGVGYIRFVKGGEDD